MNATDWVSMAMVSAPIGFVVGAASIVFWPVSSGFAALYGLQAFGTAMAIQESPEAGFMSLAGSLVMDWVFAGSSQVVKSYKYVAKIGNSLKRVKEIVPGAKMLVDVGGRLVPLKRLLGM